MGTAAEAVLTNYLRTLENRRHTAPSLRSPQTDQPVRILGGSPLAESTAGRQWPKTPACSSEVPEGGGAPSEQATLASLLLQYLHELPEEHLRNVEHLSDYLASVILDYLTRLSELRSKGLPIQTVQRSKCFWWSRCPKGHLTDEYLWCHQCVGIVCPECVSIYDPTECHLVPRGVRG